MQLPQAPDRLITESGLPAFGAYQGPVQTLNLSDFDVRSLRRGLPSRFRRTGRLYMKRWHYFGVVHPRFVLGAACVDLSYMGNLFLYLFERDSGALHEFDALLPGGRGIDITESATGGQTRAKARGMQIHFDNRVEPRTLELEARGRFGATVSLDTSGVTPLSCITRVSLGGFNYTQKAAGIRTQGTVQVEDRRYDANGGLAVMDFTAGFPPRETFWNWASGGGVCSSGKRFGMNLAAGFNETGFTENVFWLDGVPHRVDLVHFCYDRNDLMAPWQITSADGRIDLRFSPEGRRAANVNAFLAASAFHQGFGRFNGVLRSEGGQETIAEAYGFVEEHFARW